MEIQQDRITFDDGQSANYTILRIPGNVSVRFVYDKDLLANFDPDAGNYLIDQGATAQQLGRPAGKMPEEFTLDAPVGSVIVVTPTHLGWQYGCFGISHSKLIKIPDDPKIDPISSAIFWDGSGWGQALLPHADAETEHAMQPTARVGWDATPLIMAGFDLPLDMLLQYPRVQCDARNLFVFNDNKPVPPEFFQLIRPLLPTSSHELFSLIDGESIVIPRTDPMSLQDFDRLAGIIKTSNLTHLEVDRYSNGIMTLGINGKLPRQRMPLVATGFDANRNFIVAAVDGRQPGTVGCTIEEIAHLILEAGAVYASLGGGGGDVFIGQKQADGSVKPFNVPANKHPDGSFGAARRSPNAAIFTV